MKVFIIEDEQMAQAILVRTLTQNFPDIEIVGTAKSVRETVNWLSFSGNRADVIFMDVELSDGNCFEIFRQVDVEASVIMTTAYDNYAVRAFEVNSVDYLLKPIELSALKRAVERARSVVRKLDVETLLDSFRPSPNDARKRFIVRFNDSIVPVSCTDVAYFYTEEKNTYLVTKDDVRYVMDQSLDIISKDLDRRSFFRISRSCIVAMDAIDSITKQMGGRLKITARPVSSFDMTVSRSRVDDFLSWLDR